MWVFVRLRIFRPETKLRISLCKLCLGACDLGCLSGYFDPLLQSVQTHLHCFVVTECPSTCDLMILTTLYFKQSQLITLVVVLPTWILLWPRFKLSASYSCSNSLTRRAELSPGLLRPSLTLVAFRSLELRPHPAFPVSYTTYCLQVKTAPWIRF